jgi:hypothetical protein
VALAIPAYAAAATPLWNASMSTTPWTSLKTSPHDFSNSNPITTYQFASDPCQACHTPHNPINASFGPLWNHAVNSNATFYTMYGTTVAGNTPETSPNSPTLRCLGCHDGSTNVDAFGGGPGGGSGTQTIGTFFSANSSVTTDLTDDHPVSIEMQTGAGWNVPGTVTLYTIGTTDYVECASCHDPHGTTYGVKFLRLQDTCTDCHDK